MPMTKSQRDDIKQCLLDCLSDKDFMSILADKVSELQGQVAVNQKEIGNLKRKLNYFEQNQKLKHLRLYGLKEEENENLIERVQDTFSKFISINARRELFLQKKSLKGSAVVITEELAQLNYKLLQLAKGRVGPKDAWSREGDIFVKFRGKINKGFLNDRKYDVVELSETWMNSSLPSSIVSIDGYNFVRSDRVG
ncbi:hypothetical protein WA026_015517 [Henosepilachna vigintioctopunctata]|uniref:Uncharacterized protein n=1 Tax=Henosepilachna vigintioctopunctata TaxID=420089 RepID=A0AAW1VG05_9CUCU